MNRYLALRHLCWKEIRQVLPLVWMQLILGVCFQLLFLLGDNRSSMPRILLFAGMPSLFALGVGALLVGQEKERRTLDWLRSLPLAAADLLRVKLAVGLVALLVVWGLNLLLLAMFVAPRHGWRLPAQPDWSFDPGWEFLWPLQSVFFLVAGFATAWTFRSSLVALLTLIPIALLPAAASLGIHALYQRFGSGDVIARDPAPWLWAAVFVALSVLLLVVGWRRGLRALVAEAFPDKRRSWRRSPFNPWSETPVWQYPPHAPAAMLVWQFVRQNWTVLLGLTTMLLVALLLLIGASTAPGRFALAAFLLLLATSWLGVLAFHGDSLQERIRFLAERGVSPAQTWLTRHAVPLSLLAIALLAFVFLLPSSALVDRVLAFRASPSFLLAVACLVLFTYGISQAVGQVVRSATIAAIAAPAAAWLLAVYGVFLLTGLGLPLWSLAVLGLLPWLATYLLMRRWMDSRLGLGFWGTHGGLLAIGILAPLIPLGLTLAWQPTMPGSVRRPLQDEAQRYGASLTDPRELVLRFRDSEPGQAPSPQDDKPPPQSRLEEGQMVCDALATDLALDAGPIRFVPRVTSYLLGEARLARMALQQHGDSPSRRERYCRAVALLETFVQRLRLSWRVFEQDGADLIEIWLVAELARPEARTWLTPEVYPRVIRTLSDGTARQAARRRAVVLSWAACREQLCRDTPDDRLGGYSWQGRSVLYLVNRFTRRRALDYLTWQMLRWLEDGEHQDSVARRQELAKYWGKAELHYGLGTGGKFLRADVPAEFVFPVEGFSPLAPGGQWHAGWERQARELAQRLENENGGEES
jgi:hypothetical protein